MKFNKYILAASVLAMLINVACKKDNSGSGSTKALNDTSWAYAQELYLWYKTLPRTLNTSSMKDPNAVMEALRPYSTEPGFSEPVDRWSFAVTKKEWNDISAGISGDFGLNIFFMSENDLRVSYAEPNSPAGKAGIKRSWRIKSINGNNSIATDDASISRITNAIYSSKSVQIVFGRSSGADTTVSLAAITYQEQPIYLDTIYNTGGKKTGYFVYNSFLGNEQNIKSRFGSLFSKFKSEGIQEMIVDLRYNGGGYVELQNELANYLVPTAGNGNIMLKQSYNDKLSSRYDSTVYYAKKGTLDLDRIFFITTKNSASASELLINSLKPYMDVKLVGRATHGKAVGYGGYPVGDWLIFPVSFRSLNKNNEGNYFNGLEPDATVADGLDKDWGDITENCLASALNYIGNGSFSRVSAKTQQDVLVENGNSRLDKKRFKGAFDQRLLR